MNEDFHIKLHKSCYPSDSLETIATDNQFTTSFDNLLRPINETYESAANFIPSVKRRKLSKNKDENIFIHLFSTTIDINVSNHLIKNVFLRNHLESFNDIPIFLRYTEKDKTITILDKEPLPLWKFQLDEITNDKDDNIFLKSLFFVNLDYSIYKMEHDINLMRSTNKTENSRKKSQLNLQKKKINEKLKILRIMKKQGRDIKTNNVTLNFEKVDDLNTKIILSFKLNLQYKRETFNKFSTETTTFLDLLFSEKDKSITNQIVASTFIERQFIHQTINYTKQILNHDISVAFNHIPNLNLELLPFQKQSVQWMLTKEGMFESIESKQVHSSMDLQNFLNDKICYGYEKIFSDNRTDYFWNKFTNYILDNKEARNLYNEYYSGNNGYPIRAKGLLSEEMGLGKTIEILALILLNKRKLLNNDPSNVYINSERKWITKVKTTLIICPNPLLQQWIAEILQHTANNSMTVFHYLGYNGVKEKFNTKNINNIVTELSKFDVIITTYNIINTEIHYTQYNANQRSRRNQNNTPRYDYSSPLSLMEFFRIILDEVQMLKSDNTQVAKCTSLLNRIHTWGVSGTPIQNVKDFQTVLSYLKIHPFCNNSEIVSNINSNLLESIKNHNSNDNHIEIKSVLKSGISFSLDELMHLFIRHNICIRHVKRDVIDQIQIPKQTNFLIPLEFNPVEWDNYLNLWNDFLAASGYAPDGTNTARIPTAQLNQWLVRLRYICCHAIIPDNIMNHFNSGRNHRNYKKNQIKQLKSQQFDNSVHNINDILELMRMDAINLLDSLYRENIQLEIKSAQAKMELQDNPIGAIEQFATVINRISSDLQENYGILNPFDMSSEEKPDIDNKDIHLSKDETSDSTYVFNKASIGAYIDLLHQCYFFTGTAFYFLGSKKLEIVDDMNEKNKLLAEQKKELPGDIKKYTDIYSTGEIEEIEKYQLQEQKNYECAEKLRKQILKEKAEKIGEVINEVKSVFSKDSTLDDDSTCLQIIEYEYKKDYASNFLIAKLFKSLGAMIAAINDQAVQFNNIMSSLVELLYKPITKEYDESNEEEKAEEYGTSIDDQDKIFAYLYCLEQLLKNRDTIVNIEDDIIKLKGKNLVEIDPNFSEFHINQIKKLRLIKEGTSLKSTFSELKNSKIVRGSLSGNANSFENYLLEYESEIARINKENKRIRDSIKRLNIIYNSKIEYFSQLQRISDSLVSLIQMEPNVRNSILKEIRGHTKRNQNLNKINQTESRIKYLTNLRKLKELIDQNKSFNCPICLGVIHDGSIIKCGHFFCKNCIQSWLKNKHTCPICKQSTNKFEIYNFKFKNEEPSPDLVDSKQGAVSDIEVEKQHDNQTDDIEMLPDQSLNHAELNGLSDKYEIFPKINEVHKIEIKESFGAKIDFVIKLILFLKLKTESENKPAPQIILYSQNMDFLKVITNILALNNISYLEGYQNKKTISNIIDRFKTNPEITCLLLNVRTLGAGLNLLNAKHIFLLDPIINHNDELQAISRNNRIGQTEETFVWNFMIKDSVEENIMLYKHILENNKSLNNVNVKNTNTEDGLNLDKDDDDNGDDGNNGIDDADFEINANSTELVADKHLWHCFFRRE